MDTIEIDGYIGRHGLGLAPRELEATLHCARQLTAKETAREMGCSPYTVKALLDNARFKLGMQRSVRGLLMEALKRGIIAPLALLLCLATGLNTIPDRPNQRPVRTAKVETIVRLGRTEIAC
ncbi:helix-turn-helix transcriptional regulator [Stutzerimonas urumqiensis]|uniref:helix-turn-helix transcriptional regulator n=1 Tax=Stutzerimonas urumqiensis TaxID=638269 RepID=UPI003DA5209E